MTPTSGGSGRTDERVPARPGIPLIWDEALAVATARRDAAAGAVMSLSDLLARIIGQVTAQGRDYFERMWPGADLALQVLVEAEGAQRDAFWQAEGMYLRRHMKAAIAAMRELDHDGGLHPIDMVWLAPSEAELAQDGGGDPVAPWTVPAPASAAPARASESDGDADGWV